jgi:Glyoxalase/Bleomycin resistance protein/Dioxygenase superfamily
MRIGLTSIFVDDQDQAERFYTEVLGLKVKTSAPYGPEERWLTVISPEEPDGVELVLHLADEPARAFQAASRQAGRCCRCAPRTARARPSGSRPRAWCSSRNRPGCPMGAWTRSSPTPAATYSTSTRTDRRNRRATHPLIIDLGAGPARQGPGAGIGTPSSPTAAHGHAPTPPHQAGHHRRAGRHLPAHPNQRRARAPSSEREHPRSEAQ